MNCSRLASKLISPLYSMIIKIRSPIIHLSAISSDVEECRFNYCIHSDISSVLMSAKFQFSIPLRILSQLNIETSKSFFCFQHNLHLLLFCRRRLHFFCSLISIIERRIAAVRPKHYCSPTRPWRWQRTTNVSESLRTLIVASFPLMISNLLIFYCFIIDSTMLLLQHNSHSIRTL